MKVSKLDGDLSLLRPARILSLFCSEKLNRMCDTSARHTSDGKIPGMDKKHTSKTSQASWLYTVGPNDNGGFQSPP